MATGCDGENSKHELWQQTGRFSKADQAAFLSDHRSAPDRAVEDVGAAARLMAWILIMSRHTRTLAVDGTIVGRAPACTAAARQWRLPHSVQSSSCSPENCSTNLWPQSPGRDTSTTPSVAVQLRTPVPLATSSTLAPIAMPAKARIYGEYFAPASRDGLTARHSSHSPSSSTTTRPEMHQTNIGRQWHFDRRYMSGGPEQSNSLD